MSNLLDPAILFFLLGIFITSVKSNLEIPSQVAKSLSLYLLFSIGFEGGAALYSSTVSFQMVAGLGLAMVLALITPVYSFAILRRKLNLFDAAVIAGCFGSVSATTFITATSFLDNINLAYDGYMTVGLVLMESPAAIMAVVFSNIARSQAGGTKQSFADMGKTIKGALTDGSHILLVGSLLIGLISGAKGDALYPLTNDLFKGILALFLLDMGLLVGKRLKDTLKIGPFLLFFGTLVPILSATIAIVIGTLIGMTPGNLVLLATLAGSSSYIVIPAVARYAIPEANAGVYFSLSLGLTFPFNLTIGIPLYYKMVQLIGGVL